MRNFSVGTNCVIAKFCGPWFRQKKPETAVRLFFRYCSIGIDLHRHYSSHGNQLVFLISRNQLIFRFKAKQFILGICSFFNRKTNCTLIPSVIYFSDNVYKEFKAVSTFFFFFSHSIMLCMTTKNDLHQFLDFFENFFDSSGRNRRGIRAVIDSSLKFTL